MNNEFNDKMNKLKILLDEMSSEFNVQYSFNYLKLTDDDSRIERKDMLYSSNINIDSLEEMINNHIIVRSRIESITKLISQGGMIFHCLNNFNNGIEKVNQGANYLVDEISYEEKIPRYSFRGKKTSFTADKFLILTGFGLN